MLLWPFYLQLQSILVAMEPWSGAQSAFAVKAFYKNGDSLAIAQSEFRREFGIHRSRVVPSAHVIKTWVRNFEATGSTLKTKGGSVKTVRTPDNIAVVKEAIERSPHRSARRHSVSLGLSEASVRRILHNNLNFFPYKIQVTHALRERDYVNRVNFCQTFLRLINKDQELVNNLLMSDEAHFHLSGFVNKQISVIGLTQTPQNFMRDHFTVRKSQYGARYLHLELSVLTSLKMREKGL